MIIDQAKIENTKQYLDLLLRGKHPKTGQTFLGGSIYDPDVIYSLTYMYRTVKEMEQSLISLQAIVNDQKKGEAEKPVEDVVPRATYDALVAENDKLQQELTALELQLKGMQEALLARDLPAQVKRTRKPSDTPRYVKPKFELTEYTVLLRKYSATVPLDKENKMQLPDLQKAINTAFGETTVSVSLTRLQTILKDNNLIYNGKFGNQLRLIPTKLGEYYGISIGDADVDGTIKQVLLFSDVGQYTVLRLLSEAPVKKVPFEYIPDLIKCVPTSEEEVPLSKIIERINDTYALENMTKLQYDPAATVLAKQGVLVPNPDGDKPKYIPAEGMKSKGVIFYPADARFSARTAFNERGQKFVLRTLIWLLEE